MRVLELTLRGDPLPKERPRAGRGGHMYTPTRTKDAETAIRVAMEAQREETWPMTMPLGISVEFFCATRHRKDGDNMLKLLTDAMNKFVFADDSQIEEWYCKITRGVGVDDARTELFVYTLDDDGS
jgi:Holliday junction resolvase RusA-like endonuclease